MHYKPKIKKYDSQSLLLINNKGRLKRLYTPFRVQAVQPAGIIKSHSIVYVTSIIQDKQDKLLYRILNSWIPYHQFQLITTY